MQEPDNTQRLQAAVWVGARRDDEGGLRLKRTVAVHVDTIAMSNR